MRTRANARLLPMVVPAAPIYRRTFFAAWLRQQAGRLKFGALLRQLAPEKYARLRDYQSPLGYYRALLEHLATLFPVYLDAPSMFELDYPNDPDRLVAELDDIGIPIEVWGLEDELVNGDDDHLSPALALCMCYGWHSVDYRDLEALKPYQAGLTTWLADDRQLDLDGFRFPPDGRQWRGPWAAVGDLFDYVVHDTGHRFLDFSYTAVMEAGGYPPWNLAEIKSMARDWQDTLPMWKRICALENFVNAQPAKRLPLLAGVLCGDETIGRQLSVPVPQTFHPKTIAQVLA